MPLPLETGPSPSPLNYTGSKFRLLPQLVPLFPRRINHFVDLFCGGGSVGLNVPCRHLTLNDINPRLMEMFRTFRDTPPEEIMLAVDTLIDRYGLSRTDRHGYATYGCDSSRGLATFNRGPFNRLRDDLNALLRAGEPRAAIYLYVAIVYAFNNQIRFNTEGGFNLPVGKRDFNRRMRRKLETFLTLLQQPDIELSCADFQEVADPGLGEDDFVYADPPYLITCASYNERSGWTEADEMRLYATLEHLHEHGVRFALSNVSHHKGREHTLLLDWLAAHDYLHCHNLDYSYSNSNYHGSHRQLPTREVLVTNYI